MDRARESRVRATFDTVASVYDHPGTIWFDRAAIAIAEASELSASAQALDVATGTGKVALLLAARSPSAQVVGVDLSSGMLAQARKKAAAAGASNLVFQQCSFEDIDFGERFDVVTCSFGLFFVEDMERTLGHIGRQATATGRVIVSTFAEGSFAPFADAFRRLYGEYGFDVQSPSWLRLGSDERLVAVYAGASLPQPRCTMHDCGVAACVS
jgi:ubiquinone/menaquinone biosynthesis C-methylase UbiE